MCIHFFETHINYEAEAFLEFESVNFLVDTMWLYKKVILI